MTTTVSQKKTNVSNRRVTAVNFRNSLRYGQRPVLGGVGRETDPETFDISAARLFVAPIKQNLGRRLLLHALVKGVGDAVRRNDKSVADRYRRRLRLLAEEFDANPPIRDTLERLLWATDQWFTTDMVERDENKETVLELTERIMEIL